MTKYGSRRQFQNILMITVFNFIFIRDGTHQHPHGFADTGKDLQRSDTKPPSCLKKTKKSPDQIIKNDKIQIMSQI